MKKVCAVLGLAIAFGSSLFAGNNKENELQTISTNSSVEEVTNILAQVAISLNSVRYESLLNENGVAKTETNGGTAFSVKKGDCKVIFLFKKQSMPGDLKRNIVFGKEELASVKLEDDKQRLYYLEFLNSNRTNNCLFSYSHLENGLPQGPQVVFHSNGIVQGIQWMDRGKLYKIQIFNKSGVLMETKPLEPVNANA